MCTCIHKCVHIYLVIDTCICVYKRFHAHSCVCMYIHICIYVSTNMYIYMSLSTHTYLCIGISMCTGFSKSDVVTFAYQIHTEWWRSIGCLNLHVIFRTRATINRALFLQKMLYTDKASYGSSPPCINIRACFISLFSTSLCRSRWEVGGWGRDPKKCTGRDWGMGSSTI